MEKIILITGATAGMGKATALELLRTDSKVVIGARNAAHGEAARAELRAATGREDVDMVTGDFASLASVRKMAESFRNKYSHLDVLINNAGIYRNKRELSADGFEAMFAINHLAPFLLTNLLLNPLSSATQARVLNISAPSSTKLNFDDLQGETNFDPLHAFGASKMGNLLFTFDLARRLEGTGVTVNALHPGLTRTTLMNDASFFLRTMLYLMSASPAKAGRGIVKVALGDAFANRTGKFFSNGKEVKASEYAHDRDVQKKLWDVSAKLVGL
ncbi:MAG TPA: SDR family NAD(P)-dependent oxidoreductase [Anaerolineales bacterium]|jgi:NAD(P)-dependent dehydrogenase (short-subunit alcohol dehydrogenase family)|nr:SDR family NAD(P)-dependent oxidoreductase [Anaerolineales bacterium]